MPDVKPSRSAAKFCSTSKHPGADHYNNILAGNTHQFSLALNLDLGTVSLTMVLGSDVALLQKRSSTVRLVITSRQIPSASYLRP